MEAAQAPGQMFRHKGFASQCGIPQPCAPSAEEGHGDDVAGDKGISVLGGYGVMGSALGRGPWAAHGYVAPAGHGSSGLGPPKFL